MKIICWHCAGLGFVFDCPKWPECGCPEGGGMQKNCPGRSVMCVCQSNMRGDMTGEQILRRAIEEARRDPYGGKVMLTIEQAERVLRSLTTASEAEVAFSQSKDDQRGSGAQTG